MDFRGMKRKQLQSLCKQHGIPANLKNTEMADRLTLLLKEDEEPIEPVCKDFEENEGEIDSVVRTKKVKTVTFSPENETFYFVGTDKDSDSECDYNPKKKQPRKRKSMAVKQVSEKNKHVKVFEDSEGLELSVDINIVEKPGRATRSRAQKSVKGGVEAVFSPPCRKKKAKTGVEKVDVCDKPPLEVELNERVDDGNEENANLSPGLIQRQLRSRVVVSEDGGNLKALRKSLAPKGSKKTKENEGSDGVLLPSETSEDNVRARKGNATKVKVSSVKNEKPVKNDLGGRITRSRTQVEGKSSGVESRTGSLKVQEVVQEVLQLEEIFQGKDQKSLRRKSAVLLKKSVDSENNAGVSIGSLQNIRRSKRNLARDGDSVCVQLTETKFVGRRKKPKMEFVGKFSGLEECKAVPQLEEPSKGPSITSRRRFSVVQKGKELAKGDTRKRSSNTDLERASKVEESVETIEEGVVLLPNGPLRRSRRKTTLFPSAASDDRELRNHEAIGTMKQSTEFVAEKYSNVTKPVRRSSRDACEKLVIEATDDKGEISNVVKKDGFAKKILEPTWENRSSYIVHNSSSKGPQSQSSRNASKRDFVAATEVTGIAAGKNAKTESRIPIIAEEVLSANLNSPLEEKVANPNLDAGLDIPEAAGIENDVGSSSSNEIVEKSSNKRNELSKRTESFAKGQPVCFELSALYPDKYKAMEISAHVKENQPSESVKFQVIPKVQTAQDVAEPMVNMIDSVTVDDGIIDNTTAGDLDDQSCPSLNRGNTGHDNSIEQNPVECPDKPSNVVSSRYNCLGDGQSPTCKQDCEGQCSKLLDLKGLETGESLTVETTNQTNHVVDEKLVSDFESFSKSLGKNENPITKGEPVCKDSGRNTEKSSEIVEEISAFDRTEMVQVDAGSVKIAETSAETVGGIASDTVAPSASSLVKKAQCVDGNQFEAQATIVGESNINCIGREEFCSCETEHPDEATSSKNVELPCGHEKADVFVQEDNESCKALDFEQIVVEVDASEGFERNSKLDDGAPDKTDGQVAEDKQEVLIASGNIKEKHGHDLSDGDRTIPIALEESVTDKVGSNSKTEDSAGEHIQSFSSCELPHVMSKVGDQLQDIFKLPVEGINRHERDEALLHGNKCQNLSFNLVGVLEEHAVQASTEVCSNHENSMDAMVGETESGSLSDSDLAKMQNGKKCQGPSNTGVSVDSEVLQSVLRLDQVTCGDPDIHKEACKEKKRHASFASDDCMYTDDSANNDYSGVLEEHAVAANKRACSNHESSMDTKVDETESGCVSDFDLAKMQNVNDYKSRGPSNMVVSVDSEVLPKDASLGIKRCTSFSSDDCRYMDDNTNMDGNAGTLDSGSKNMNSKTEVNSDNAGDCLVGGELVDLSSCVHGIILSNDIESNRVSQINADLAGAIVIFDTGSKREVQISADNSWAKPQLHSGYDSLDESTTFQEDNVALENKAESCLVNRAYLNAVNGTNVDKSATSRENTAGLPDFQKDNRALEHDDVESEFFTHWEINSVFGNAEEDVAKKPDEKKLANAELAEEPTWEDNEGCNEQDNASAIIQEYIDREKHLDEYFGVKNSNDSIHEAMLTVASRTGDKIYESALGACIDVANRRSNEVSETPLQSDEVTFGSLGKFKEVELDKHASVASGDSISTDDETAEITASVGMMEVEPSSKDISVDAQREYNLDVVPVAISDNISDQLAEKECHSRNDNSLDDTVGYGHRNDKAGSNEVGTRSVKEIIGIQNVDDTAKLVELRSDGGNLLEERNSLDVNSFSAISSSMDNFGPDNDPERRDLPMQEGENFGMEERASVDSPVPVTASSHENTALELNVGSAMFTSIEMKELFRDDKIDGIVKSDSEMSKVSSMIEYSEDAYEGKERAGDTSQVAEGQDGDHEHILEEIVEQKSTQEMDIRCQTGFSITDFSNSGDSISVDDKTAVRIENVRKMDAESSPKDINFDCRRQCNFEALPVAISKNIDASDNDPKRRGTPMQGDKSGVAVIVPADSPVTGSSHENEASELNVASPLFTSFEMKEFFCDDNIDGILKSDPEMSNVNSMIEDGEDVKKGKESDVGTPQVVAGQHGDHGHEFEEVEELKSTQKLDTHCHADSPNTDFSSCGDELQELDAVLIEDDKVSEDIKEEIENVSGNPQVSAEQSRDHGKRMAEEVRESDENTCVGEGLKEEGDETGDIEYSCVSTSAGKMAVDAKMSGIISGPFDFPAASDPNPDVDDTLDQCLASANFVSRKEKSESPKKECWKPDLNKSRIVSSAARLENKESLILSAPQSVVNTFYMKENLRSTKVDRFTKSAAETLKPRRALEDLGKK